MDNSVSSKNRVVGPVMTKPLTVRNRFENTDVEFNNRKQLNFVSGFKANYHFLRAFGLWPFSFACGSNGEIRKPKITKIDLLWFIISIHLYISASIVFYINTTIEPINMRCMAKRIINKGDYILLALSLIFISLSIAIDAIKLWVFP